jgi:hypothetical protein
MPEPVRRQQDGRALAADAVVMGEIALQLGVALPVIDPLRLDFGARDARLQGRGRNGAEKDGHRTRDIHLTLPLFRLSFAHPRHRIQMSD